MSASREKKVRQEQVASGYVNPRTQKEEQERKADRRSRILYTTIAVVFVIVAVAVITWNSGVIQKNATAVTIDGEKYTAADVSYFYHYAYNQWYQTYGSYASYFGLDTSSSLNSQVFDQDTGETWADYFCDQGITTMKWTIATYNAAMDSGYEWTDANQESVDSTLSSLETYAANNSTDVKTYLKYVYGSMMTQKVFEKYLKMQTVATAYATSVYDGYTYTDSDISDYYASNKNDFDIVNYEYVTADGSVATTDADGNTVEVTDDMKTAAMATAKEAADSVLARYNAGETLKAISEDGKDYTVTYNSEDAGTYSDTDMMNWLFDGTRKDGDATVIANDTSYNVVVFHSRSRNDYSTVDVRHILFKVDTSGLDSSSDTYESDVAALKAEAQAKAEDVLKKWEAGAKTEDSFATLADENSEDTGTSGGLYTKVYKGQMADEFNSWIFDPSRKSGDVDIVYTESYGYHIIYFVGTDVPYWQVQVENTLRSNDYNSWSDGLTSAMTVTEGSGLKYVKS